jgi:hypothetical protein
MARIRHIAIGISYRLSQICHIAMMINHCQGYFHRIVMQFTYFLGNSYADRMMRRSAQVTTFVVMAMIDESLAIMSHSMQSENESEPVSRDEMPSLLLADSGIAPIALLN